MYCNLFSYASIHFVYFLQLCIDKYQISQNSILLFPFQGLPGQRINFTLLDFAVYSPNRSNSPNPTLPHCHVYVIFKDVGGSDGAGGRSITICGGKKRVLDVYFSTSHKVEVRVLGRNRNFVVNYTGIFFQYAFC